MHFWCYYILFFRGQSLSLSPVQHSFRNFNCLFYNSSLCPVPVICIPISSLQPFLKSASNFIHFPPSAHVSWQIHHWYTVRYIAELFSLLFHTLDIQTSAQFVFSTEALLVCPFFASFFSSFTFNTMFCIRYNRIEIDLIAKKNYQRLFNILFS